MVDQRRHSPLRDFATWEPVLRLLRADHAQRHAARPTRVTGDIGRGSWSMHLPWGQVAEREDTQEETDAVRRVQRALTDAGADDVTFIAEVQPAGKTVLRLLGPSPAVESGISPYPGALILVEGAVPEPWRRRRDGGGDRRGRSAPGPHPARGVEGGLPGDAGALAGLGRRRRGGGT